MNIQYNKWLDIVFSHTYFKDGKSNIFELIPLQDTSRILRNYNILMDKRVNVFSFFLGLQSGENLNEQLQSINDLYFQMTISDFQFFNYTELEPNSGSKLFYLSNAITDENTHQLQKSANVSTQDLIEIKPKRFTVKVPSGETTIDIKNASGISIFQKSVSVLNEVDYSIDISNQDDGKYELWINNALEELFFASSQELLPNCFGIVHLNIATLLKNNQEDMGYRIDFKSREVYRKYQIIIPDSRNIDVTSIQIKSPQGDLYEGPLENEIIGGQTAQVFKSKNKIAFQQEPDASPELTVSYTSRVSHTASTLDIKLPNPDVGSISKEENEESFFSSTIVYV